MEMKMNRLSLIAISMALLAGSACSGKKPTASAPSVQKTPPPPIRASAPPAAQSKTTAASPHASSEVMPSASPAQAEVKPAPPADPIADLIARVEKHYQAGQ